MPIDKSWLDRPNRNSNEYRKGVKAFVKMCKTQLNENKAVRCACNHCKNGEIIPYKAMKAHMASWGFYHPYKIWSYHGECSNPPVVADVGPRGDTHDLLEDLMQAEELMDVDADLEERNSEAPGSDGRKEFDELLKEAGSELYPGCKKFTSLDWLAKTMHIKVMNKISNSAMDQMLELMAESHPEGNRIPTSNYQAKKILKKIGLGYEAIHVCKNDCAIFYDEYESFQNCPECKESRWVDKKTKGKKVAHKVLRYFPVGTRLRRLYALRHTAKDMIWHSTGRSEDGTLRHPVDGTAWKDFDLKYPEFSSEPRNVRLGLAADGFNPFSNMSLSHSTWPVILTTYNLPPWLCMKESSFMLTLLIPGPKSPGKDMDVFLKPLVKELDKLWRVGICVKDALTDTSFTMKAALLWTINDFPARSSLSGWSGQGYKACPTCNEDTPSYRVINKVVYVGHRRWLKDNDPWRKNLEFNGLPENKPPPPPRQFSPSDIEDQHRRLNSRKPGKHPDHGGVTQKREEKELNWSKRSIFFELPYWSSLKLKHNLDVMHIEKNVCDSLLGTLLMNKNSKDTSNARADLKKLVIRKRYWLRLRGNKWFKPHPKYSFTEDNRTKFCQFVKDVKLPDGFGSNISKRVAENNTNISGLKSHDCHILMQRLIPTGVRGLLSTEVIQPIVDLCNFFKMLCCRTLKVEDMKKLKELIIIILCKLELIYPPAFFDIMVHLLIHLPDEAILGGPVFTRWMYSIERYMKKLKNFVRNKARPEGCIAEGYVAEEALTFCSLYLQDVQTRFNRPDRNEDVIVEKRRLWMFESKCRPASAMTQKQVTFNERQTIEWFLLDSCDEVGRYIEQFENEHPQSDVKTEFRAWFLDKVFLMKIQNSPDYHEELYALSMGVESLVKTYTACIVNGVRFMVLGRDTQRTTQNSGVEVEDQNKVRHYGQIEEIIEVNYQLKCSTVLFRCKWFDPTWYIIDEANGITTINTEHEWNEEEQLVYASQAKQVFYVREPSRENEDGNHRWVVEGVHHRKIWDLPLNNDPVADVHNNSIQNTADEVDVVHNNSSSNCNFVINFSQYFQNSTLDATTSPDVLTDEPTVTVHEVSDAETDYDEHDPEYDIEEDTLIYDGDSD